MSKRITTVKVTEEVWREINTRKELGETCDDVLRKALELPEKEAQ